MMRPRLPILTLLPLLPLVSLACAAPHNPSFPLTVQDAGMALTQMRAAPKPLPRPLVIVGGYLEFGIGPALMRGRLQAMTGDDRIATVSLYDCADFDDCRAKVVKAVDAAFPTTDPTETTEVDVIGISMGGVAARYAAAAPEAPAGTANQPRRLRVARLFTVSSPHQGAVLANMPTFHKLCLQMRPDSDFVATLNTTDKCTGYAFYPYVRLQDGWVGESHAAPPGRRAWWVPGRWFEDSHVGAASDPRILADIARRLRGETPFTQDPPAPLPDEM